MKETFKRCPKCQKVFEIKESADQHICPSCGIMLVDITKENASKKPLFE